MMICVLCAVLLQTVLASAASRRRFFYDSPNGQIHCVARDADGPVVLAIHGNPRSTDEFSELFDLMDESEGPAYMAVDFFGQGASDVGASNYTTIQEYAEHFFAAASSAFPGRPIIPMGSYTGAAVAIEVARLHPEAVSKVVLHVPFHYDAEAYENVLGYGEYLKHWEPVEDGSHLIEEWEQISYQPWNDLWMQSRKTIDRLRAATTQWSVILAHGDYSHFEMLPALADLGTTAETMLVWGDEALQIFEDAELNAFAMVDKVEASLGSSGGTFRSEHVDGGNEALMAQNATVVLELLYSFM